MRFSKTYTTIDTHTAGEPLRIITAGAPLLQGDTILAKRRYAQMHLDHVRRALMLEPRGHADMYGAYLTPPVTSAADFGVIFLHNEGYSTMCGHGIIALATVAVAQGWVDTSMPEVRVGIDSPAGFIEAFVMWDGENVQGVRFLNVPSFMFQADVAITTPSFGPLTVDIAFGGAFYAYLSAGQVGLHVSPEQYRTLITLGDEVKHAIEAQFEVKHPLEPELQGIYGTIIDEDLPCPEGITHAQRNICIFADREVDRSPTGTGTSGRIAQLIARNNLSIGQTLLNHSIIDTAFTGQAVQETTVAHYNAIIPEIRGQAFITGFCQWMIDPDDPVGDGFFLR